MYDFFFFFQIAALFVYLMVYKKLVSPYTFFGPFLFLITLYESGKLLGWLNINQSSVWSFNIYTSVEFIFYSAILLAIIRNKIHKQILFYALILTLCLTVVYIVFFNSFNAFNSFTFTLQAFIIITACCMYYYYKIQDADNEVMIIEEPTFWLYTGLLFYYLGGFLFFASYSGMAYQASSNYLILYRIVVNVSNIFLYSCLIKLFLCFRQTKI